MTLHEWRVKNADGDMTMNKRIVTATKDRAIASAKLKAMYGNNSPFFQLVYVGTFEDHSL